MKGRRARIRNQKRSKHYRSWLDRSLDKAALAELKKIEKEKSQVNMPKRPLYRTEGLDRAQRESAKFGLFFIIVVVIIGVLVDIM
jgi:hypothetical protein